MSYFIAHLEDGSSYSEKKLIKECKLEGSPISAWDWLRNNNKLEQITSLELKLPSGSLVNIPRRHPSWQFFQFKYGVSVLGRSRCMAQIIGAVVDIEGNSIIACYVNNSPDTLLTIDNIHDLRLFRIGHINFKLHNIKLPVPEGGCNICR